MGRRVGAMRLNSHGSFLFYAFCVFSLFLSLDWSGLIWYNQVRRLIFLTYKAGQEASDVHPM